MVGHAAGTLAGTAVRVAGFSQTVRLIDKELQDHIIARTRHKG